MIGTGIPAVAKGACVSVTIGHPSGRPLDWKYACIFTRACIELEWQRMFRDRFLQVSGGDSKSELVDLSVILFGNNSPRRSQA